MSGKREELARAVIDVLYNDKGLPEGSCLSTDVCPSPPCACVSGVVDAILDCLMKPSGEMLVAAMGGDSDRVEQSPATALARKAIWQAMLQAIKEETPDREAGGEETGHSGE